jgi:hypothetical protein
MKTLNHKVIVDNETYWVDLDISNIHWNNNGIGYYEYWGMIGFDRGKDYVEEFEIDKISIDNIPVTDSVLYNAIYEILIKDPELYLKIEEKIKQEKEYLE